MNDKKFNLACPIPISDYPKVLLSHGGGGKLMNKLIDEMFRKTFDCPELNQKHDGAILSLDRNKVAFTTDSFVVDPLFFPGGDIGSLAVYGTVNDLAMCGAKPLYLSVSLIIEEGFSMEKLWKIIYSMKEASLKTGVKLVTGDTKVVNKGQGDGLFINTAGIGEIFDGVSISPNNVSVGDVVIVSGDIGRHGISVMAKREGINFETEIESDLAPLNDLVLKVLESDVKISCMRDLTRGGLASALVEISEASNKKIRIEEDVIPVAEEVKGACELLGFDPLYVANEGRFVLFVDKNDADKVLNILQQHEYGKNAKIIGEVSKSGESVVTINTIAGVERIVEMLSGEQLPRIC